MIAKHRERICVINVGIQWIKWDQNISVDIYLNIYFFSENEPAYLPFPPSRVTCPRRQPYFTNVVHARWDVYCISWYMEWIWLKMLKNFRICGAQTGLRYSSDSSASITVITGSMSLLSSLKAAIVDFDFNRLWFLVSKYCFL